MSKENGQSAPRVRMTLPADVNAGMDATTLSLGRTGVYPVYFYRNGGSEISPIEIKVLTKLDLKISTPLVNQKDKRVIESITILEFYKGAVVAHEVGVIKFGREVRLISFFKFRAPYALNGMNKIEILIHTGETEAGKEHQKKLVAAIEKVLQDRSADIDPFYSISKSEQYRDGIVESSKPVTGFGIVFVTSVNLIKGIAVGVNSRGEKVLMQLSNFMNKAEAVENLHPAMFVKTRGMKTLEENPSGFNINVFNIELLIKRQGDKPIATKEHEDKGGKVVQFNEKAGDKSAEAKTEKDKEGSNKPSKKSSTKKPSAKKPAKKKVA